MITLKEIKQVEKACRGHFRAINEFGSFCASEPCSACTAYSIVVREAAKAGLDNLKTCPEWLVLAIAQRRSMEKPDKFCRACGQLIKTSGEEVCNLCNDISKLGKEAL